MIVTHTTISKTLLEQIKNYMEAVEEKIDGEWGYMLSAEQLVANKLMPTEYFEVCNLLATFQEGTDNA